MSEQYEVCVIGAGTAGFAAAEAARSAGRRLLLVTGPGDLGGTCILRGCMPAKTLLSATERLGELDSARDMGVDVERVRVDVPAIIARKRELVEYFSADRLHELETYPLVRGRARFVARDTIEAAGRRISADRFILATGSRIGVPAIPGLPDAGYLTSDDVLELTAIPASIVVIGGGPVGCEFAQYFARLGARVTLLQDGPQLLRNEDTDVADAVARALQAEGVEVVCNSHIGHCTRSGSETVVTYTVGDIAASVHAERVMLASGRVPNVAGLNLEVAGVVADDEHVAVDPYLRTTNRHILAAGDVVGRRCLVHVAAYAGKLALANAFAENPQRADFDRFETHAIDTQPQIAVAGLTEATCAARGLNVFVKRHAFDDIGMARVADQTAGFVKMIAAADGRIVGVAIVGNGAIDLIGEAVALIDRGASVTDAAQMPHMHPTLGEIIGRVAEDLGATLATTASGSAPLPV